MGMRSRSRITRIRTGCGISLALLLGAATASAQPSPAPAARSAAPLAESAAADADTSGAVNRFVQAAATPTHIIGKVARWEVPICPYALGMPDDAIARVVQRVKGVAAQAGVRVSSDAACKPNIVIAFTSTPQDLLDNIRRDHTELLGYHAGSQDLARLATVTRPIQAWYSTATIDLQGRQQSDGRRTGNDRGLQITAPCILIGGAGKAPGNGGQGNGYRDPNALCTVWLPHAIKATVEASRLADRLRATFDRVTIIANPSIVPAGMSAIEDYIAVLALAQINSLDKCQALPSITNLLASGCTQAGSQITANDLSYLKAVYRADAGGLPGVQKNEIARRMEQGIAGQ